MSLESFELLIEKLSNRLQYTLPGASAHETMRAIPSGSVIPKFEHKTKPKPGAVLILLYPEENKIRFPLIQRPVYTGTHSGQVSLPGGKAEGNESIIETALREGHEEIGVLPESITVIGKLSDFFVIPSNFLVTPIIGYTNMTPSFIPDQKEVDRILIGSLDQLIADDAIRTKEIVAAGRFNMNAPHFEVESQIVWGATAMMLNEFRTILRELER